jgi:hypothetical protein
LASIDRHHAGGDECDTERRQERILSSGDVALVRIVRALPEESWGRLKEIFAEAGVRAR